MTCEDALAAAIERAAAALGWHRLAEHLMDLGDIREAAGEYMPAWWCYVHAAECEREALYQIPEEHARTRQIIAGSAACCDFHADGLKARGGNGSGN